MSDHLIIYPNFGQRISEWDIGSACGKYNIPLMDTADNDSVIVYVDNNGQTNNIDYKHIHSKELFSIGMKVAISDEVNKYGRHVSGYISKINADSVDIIAEIDGNSRTFRINDYKIISAYGKSNQPDTLVATIKPTDKGKLKLSYLFGNIGWEANYKLIVNEDKIIKCILGATIVDQNTEDLEGDVTLVAGSISRPRQTQTRSLMLSASPVSDTTQQGKFQEYYKYNIGHKELADETRVELVSCDNVESKKYYSHDVSTNTVSYGYKFTSPTFFPSGKVYIYNNDLMYIGTSHISEHREGDKVDIKIGPTTQVQANTVLTKVGPSEDNNEYDVKIETNVTNGLDNPVLFTIKYYIGTDKVIKTNLNYTRIKNGYVEWDLMANPKKGKVIIDLVLEK